MEEEKLEVGDIIRYGFNFSGSHGTFGEIIKINPKTYRVRELETEYNQVRFDLWETKIIQPKEYIDQRPLNIRFHTCHKSNINEIIKDCHD